MKYKVSQKSIRLLIILFPLAVLLIYGFVTYLFLSYIQQNDTSKEVARYEKLFLDNQKEVLKERVENLTDYIDYYAKKRSDLATTEIQDFVESCANIADNLYFAGKGKNSILSAFKDVKFSDNSGQIFLMNMHGYVYLHFDKSLEQRIAKNLTDADGRAFVQDFIRMIQYEKAGFILYSWYKPGYPRARMYDNLAYVKKLAYGDWFIGAGFFPDELQKSIRKDIIDYIDKHMKVKDGFFYIMDKNQNIVYCPEEKVSKELQRYALQDMFIDAKNNLYYSKFVKEYGWYIVGVKNLHNSMLEFANEQLNKNSMVHDVKKDLMLLGIALLASILLSLYLSSIIYRKFKNYERQLNESHDKMMFRTKQALIGELFSMIAHQWRQPINKIASIVALMRAEMHGGKVNKKELDNSLEEIEESIEYMSETIEDFRTFYKPTTAIKVVNLKDLIKRSVAFLSNAIEKKEVKVIQKLADDIEIKLYRNEFLQVMLNLLKNAIDATDVGGVITLRLYRHAQKVIISVENSGKPISEEVMKKIFQPYFTTKKDSMGLGLYMTKIIVEKHLKGEILIERLENGTKFLIII